MMAKFQQKKWFWSRRGRLLLGSKEMQGTANKVKGSVFAVILGLLIGVIVIAATGNNPLTYFHYLLFFAFSNYGYNQWDNTLVWWAIYIVAGLALVMSFKTGMFNIGVVGQILAAGAVVIAIGVRYDLSQPVAIIVAMLAGVAAAVLVAGVTAALKVWFNVHEVVTSILLNWTIWYLVKWLIMTSNLYDASRGATLPLNDGMSFALGGYKFILPLVIALLLVVGVWFLLKKTALGYKVKTVGLNPFAADYAGISRRHYGFTSFVISGALAGVMGVFYYGVINPSFSFATDTLPAIGFDSISVALVGQISPIGTVGAAFLWGIIKSGGPIGSVGLGLPEAVSDIMFGVIIYSAACAVLLSRIAPIKSLISYFNVISHGGTRKKYHHYLSNIWKSFLKTFKIRKNYNQKIKTLKKAHKNNNEKEVALKQQELNNLVIDKKDNVQVCYAHMHQQWQTLKNFFAQEYQRIWTSGLKGIKNKAIQSKKQVYGEKLNQYISERITYEEKIHALSQDLENRLNKMKKQESYQGESYKSAVHLYRQQIKIETSGFNQRFYQLVDEEQGKLLTIKKQFDKEKMAYQKKAGK